MYEVQNMKKISWWLSIEVKGEAKHDIVGNEKPASVPFLS